MMLHADMTLLKQYKTCGPYHTPNCEYHSCPDREETAKYVSYLPI